MRLLSNYFDLFFCAGVSSSPHAGVVDNPPLLRPITEQQSHEERDTAGYQLHTTTSASGEDNYQLYEDLPVPDDDGGGGVSSQVGWTYVDYMKAAGLDPGERELSHCIFVFD